MLAAAVLSLLLQPAPIVTLKALLKDRDIDQVRTMASPEALASTDFRFPREAGAYGVGRLGWSAKILKDAANDQQYVVFATPLTSQDIGEPVFKWNGQTIGAMIPETDSRGIRIRHHSFQVAFDMPQKATQITDNVEFVSSGQTQDSFFMRLSPAYQVGSIRDEKGEEVPFTQASGVVSVKRPSGEKFKLSIQYVGKPNLPQFAGSISDQEILLTNDYWYPIIARMPSTYDARILAPKGWVAIANGERTGKSLLATADSYSYKNDMPLVYFSLSVGPFKEYEESIGGRKFRLWSKTLSAQDAKTQAEYYAPILKFYDKIAPFPFSGYGAIDSPAYGGGALEAYSHATYGGGLPSEDGHEPAHTWFGGMLNCTYLNSFWNESFAVFLDGLSQREMEIGNISERRLAHIQDALPSPAYARIACDKGGAHTGGVASTLGYGKGADVLQMLEVELGTPTMMSAMKKWIAEHPKGEPAEWSDFESVVNKVSKTNMSWFFDQWIKRPGWAEFSVVDVSYSSGAIRGAFEFSKSPFFGNYEALVQFPDGKREYVKIPIHEKNVSASGVTRYDFSITVNRKPSLLSIDPWRRVLRQLGRDEEPISIRRNLNAMSSYVDPKRKNWAPYYQRRTVQGALPNPPENVLMIGSPETTPAMKPWCDKAGITVKGDTLTYQGEKYDLKVSTFAMVFDMGNGKRCGIALGRSDERPKAGRAYMVLTDHLGRILRAKTEPKTSGNMVFTF